MHILVVEDEPDLRDVLREGLEESGYEVDVAADGEAGEAMARRAAYDLLIVDWILPKQDGPALVRRLRAADVDTPVLMLSARARLEDRVDGLDAGADDYLTKPFAFAELLARIRALARRPPRAPERFLDAGELVLDLYRRAAFLHDEPLDLQPREFALLEQLVRHQGTVVPRATLAEQVWDAAETSEDALNMAVSRLRRQLAAARPGASGEAVRIETVRGTGYRLHVSA